MSRNMWCKTPKEYGQIVSYDGKNYKVIGCAENILTFTPSIGIGYDYYLTLSEVV